ncbi:hypothetical protein G9P44_005937 [Scheffersomyces stipitis]|nr:hypothetical protein G9P44_005937 [Scheffersomyces stipitis]
MSDEKGFYTPIEVAPSRKQSWLKRFAAGAIGAAASLYLLSSAASYLSTEISETEAKKIILDALETNLAGNWSKIYTAEPHLAGTNFGLVQFTRDKFEEYGLDASIDTYEIYVSYPNDHDLNLLDAKTEEILYKAPLKEDVLKEDETTHGNDTVPTFWLMSLMLQEWGVDVKGKIVIVRYGAIFRGLKVKFAQENGAIGVLIYSDPGDDHGITEKTATSSIPTPGVEPNLEKLNGEGHHAKEDSWIGELEGFKYYTGPSKNYTLNLYNDQIYNISTLYNVYGEIPGEKRDEVIIIGNHRDAWIKAGYKFKRTIVFQSYDGEEYGLLGSTEQGEYFADKYKRTVVAYLNLDASTTGSHLKLGVSPLLNNIPREAAKELEYPAKGVGSLYDHFVQETGDNIKNLGSGSDYTVFLEHLGIPSVDLGFGQGKGDPIYHYHSNYDSFYWISEFADKGFVYHNLAAKYLSLIVFGLGERELINFKLTDYSKDLIKYYNETIKAVPKKWFHQEISQETWDKYLNHDIADIEFISKATSRTYLPRRWFPFPELLNVRDCKMKGHLMYDSKHHKNATLEDLLLKTLEDINTLQNSTVSFDLKTFDLQSQHENKDDLNFWQRFKLHFQIKGHNKLLQYFERNFLYHKGLYERPWFKHIVFASGRFTGYEGQTFPGLKEALEDGDFERFVDWLGIVSKAIRRINAEIAV